MKEQRLDEIPDRAALQASYAVSRPGFDKALGDLLSGVATALRNVGIRPTLKGRVKDFDSYYEKKLRLLRKARNEGISPIPVNDVIAVRAVCPFMGDLATAERALCKVFDVVEIERKGAERSFREFGYESIHLLARIPDSLAKSCPGLERDLFEIQLRTILQEAWAEVEHELVYKAEFTPFDEPMKRKLAALNANLTLSDIIFQEILEYQKLLNGELAKRRSAFYEKIEEVADSPERDTIEDGSFTDFEKPVLPEVAGEGDRSVDQSVVGAAEHPAAPGGKFPITADADEEDMDRLLLLALAAHNNADYAQAVALYGQIIARNPGREAAAVVYKHRGMAYFARSLYGEAKADFSSCLALDARCYKAAYYRGVVKSVEQDHIGAAEDFTLALDIHPYHFFSRYRRAMAWWRLGDAAQALSDCEIALHIQPDNALALRLRDRIRERMNTDDF